MFLLGSKLSKTTQILFVSFFVICSMVIFVDDIMANALGLAPPVIRDEMELNERIIHAITLTRSGNLDKEIKFEISLNEVADKILDLYNGSIITIPSGENQARYFFAVDTKGLQYGSYLAEMYILELKQTETGVGNFKTGFVEKININILPIVKKNREISAFMVLEYINDLIIRVPKVSVLKNKTKTYIDVTAELINKTNFSLRGVPYKFIVYNDEKIIEEKIGSFNKKIPKDSTGLISETFEIENRYKTIGKYKFVYKIGDLTTELNYFLIPPEYVVLALVGLILPFSIIHLTCRRDKKKKC